MNLSSILIVRRPGTQSISGNRQSPSPAFSHLESGVELLFLDIRGKEGPQKGFALKKQVRQTKDDSFGMTLGKTMESLVFTHKPEMVFILTEGDDRTEWDKTIVQILRNSVSGLPVYTGPTPFPLASRVCLGDFETGPALAAHLAQWEGQTMHGTLDFWVGQEFMEKGGGDILGHWIEQRPGKVAFGLHMPVGPKMDHRFIEEHLSYLFENGLSMIHWEMAGHEDPLPKELLWKVSKQGIWNHVSGNHLFDSDCPDASWILNTPNIIHSFEDMGAASPDAGVTPPPSLLSYGKLPGLPGRPLWQVIRNPLLLLPCLGRIPQQQVLRMRVDEATGSIFGIGTAINYFYKTPDRIPGDLMDEIIDMVDAGGSVDITHVRDNLKKAYLIGYAVENGRVIGNSSLKHPRPVFIDRLKGMTGLDFTHCVERGYTSVRPEYRAMGIGAKLLEGLTERAVDVKVFSIISEDNLATQKIAIRNNTRKITTYFSDKLKKEMGVWMPEHMITKEWEPGK